MTRGRKPDPPHLKVIKANDARTVLPGPFAEIREAGDPPKPAVVAMDEVASAEWDRLVGVLADKAILAPVDMAHLTAYCSAWSRLVQALVELKGPDVKMTVTNFETGAVKANPLIGIAERAEASLVKFAAALGLGPTERGRITTAHDLGAQKKSKLSEWTSG